ncbi:hypothetical protein HPB49_021208 [Dermacentor silvarum]|uniref:Uncharacterized protein n=1 Tax=Dermacentor silvarum TaxID=543639 RepID=A0ACB8CB98_DERSI|nr:hypothetical protein HPB49_021208 [Dermacentor silvarum]
MLVKNGGGLEQKKTSPCIYYSTGGRMPKRKTDSHCYAPGCHSGYPGAPKASLFAAPTEDELRKKWERNLRRADKPLTESSVVCELHFEPRYILRDYVHIINGTEERLPRGEPSLAPGAVPTLLPDCASYLSVAPVKERPERKRSAAASAPAVGIKHARVHGPHEQQPVSSGNRFLKSRSSVWKVDSSRRMNGSQLARSKQ